MKIIVFALATALSIANTALAVDPIHSDFRLLKPFRTYVRIGRYVPIQDNFWIHYVRRGSPTAATLAADSPDQARVATPIASESLRLPSTLPGTEVPASKLVTVTALVDRLVALDSAIDRTTVRARYLGRFHNVEIFEDVPLGALATASYVALLEGAYSFRVAEDLGVLEPTWDHRLWNKIVCQEHRPDSCIAPSRSGQTPIAVDFVMPEALEGTTPLTAHFQYSGGGGADYQAAYTSLEARILDAVRAIADGTYVNPLPRILAAQGSTVLPPEALQEVQIAVVGSRYVRGGGSPAKSVTHYAKVRTEELLGGAVTRTITLGTTGLTATLTIDLASGTVDLTGTFENGVPKHRAFNVSRSTVVSEGSRSYIFGHAELFGGGSSTDPFAYSIDFTDIGPNEWTWIHLGSRLTPTPVRVP